MSLIGTIKLVCGITNNNFKAKEITKLRNKQYLQYILQNHLKSFKHLL